MKFMKRSLTLMLAGLMAFSMVACGDKGGDADTSKETSVTTDADGRELVGNTYKTGLPIVKDEITLSCLFQQNASDYSKTPNDKDLMKILNEETNIKIDWLCEQGDIGERVNLAMATEATMPDMVMAWPTETHIAKNLRNMIKLTDMMEDWAPNIVALAEENIKDGIDDFKQADGEIYTLPSGVYSEPANASQGVLVMQTKWLDNVGMELPTTTDELVTVLEAFRDKDANGNGDTKDEIPLGFCGVNWCSRIMSFSGPWGIAGRSPQNYDSYFLIKDGKFVPTIDTQAFRDYLTYMNKLASDNLINSDGFTIDNAAYNALLESDAIGTYSTWYEPLEEWAIVPILTTPGYEGQEAKSGEIGYRTANMNGFFITRACDEPEAALRFWDEWHRDAYTQRVCRDGLPGENGTWLETEDGGAVVNTPVEYPTGISTITEHNYTFGFRSAASMQFASTVAKPVAGSGTSDDVRYIYNDFCKDYFLTDFLPLYIVDQDQLEIRNELRTELEEYMDSFIANAIVQGTGLDDAGWAKHVETLQNDLDLQAWIDWNQSYYDGEFKN